MTRRPRKGATIYQPKPKPAPPKRDKLERLLEQGGIGSVAGSPLFDPLFMPVEKFAARQSIREQLARWRNSGPLDWDAVYITLPDGTEVRSHEFYERQHRIAYELLLRNTDHRTIAATTHLDLAEVAEIAADHNLK